MVVILQVDLYTTWGKIWSCGGAGQCGTCIVQVTTQHTAIADATSSSSGSLLLAQLFAQVVMAIELLKFVQQPVFRPDQLLKVRTYAATAKHLCVSVVCSGE